jgi:hypothetical protein
MLGFHRTRSQSRISKFKYDKCPQTVTCMMCVCVQKFNVFLYRAKKGAAKTRKEAQGQVRL